MGAVIGEMVVEELVTDAFVADVIAGSEIAGPLLTAGGDAVLGKVAGVAMQIGTNFLAGQVLGMLSPKRGASNQFSAVAQGALINSVSNVDPIPVVYGSRTKGGTRVLTEVSGASNEFLNLVIVWSEGPISAINTVYLDGVAIGDARFSGLTYQENYLGADAQAASAALVAELADSAKWNASCTLSGVAYTYLRLRWDKTAFPSGLPNVTADLDGRTLYDPRTALTGFSRNPWLAIRDYLTHSRYGRGIDASVMIDDTTFQTEANHADVAVSIPGGGTQARYTCDGIVNVDDKPFDNLRALMSSCRGFMVFSGGKYKARTERLDAPVSFALTEDNTVGAWSFATADKRSTFNRVKARFFDAAQSWQPNIAVQESSTYRSQDGGLVLETTLELPFTKNLYTAEQICQVTLKRSRFGILVQLTATIAATQLEVGDVVALTNTTPGWVGVYFRVIEMELLASDEVRLVLLQYDDSAYTLDALALVSSVPTSRLPDPLHPAAPGAPSIAEALYQTTGSAGVKSRATLIWMASADTFVQQGGFYQVERSPTGAGSWTVFPRIQSPGTGTVTFFIDDQAAAVYDYRVKAFNSVGAGSSYSPTTTKEIAGLTAAPSNVASFAVQSYSGQAKFTWAKPSQNSDLDVLIGGRTYIRWSPLTSGATWDHGSLVNPDGYPGDTSIGFGPLMTGTYLAKHCDSSGNYSAAEASFVVTEALITGLTTIATVTESPAFTGAKSNVAAVDGGIQLDSVTLIDSMATLMDDWGSIDSLGGVQATGTYTFANTLDLGSKTPARLFTTLGSLAYDVDDLIDSRTNNIDDWGPFDGATVEDVEAQLMVRTSDDNISYSSYYALGLVGDFNFRYFQFRLDFASGNATHNRSVTSLSVTAKH